MPLVVDLSELPARVRNKIHADCTRENGAQARLALIRQQKIAKFFADNTPRSIDGVGAQEMAIDPYLVNYLQIQHGADFYQDTAFRDWVRSRFEEFRVQSTGTKIMAGYGTKSGGATRKRFSQRFNGPSGRAPGEHHATPTPNVTTK